MFHGSLFLFVREEKLKLENMIQRAKQKEALQAKQLQDYVAKETELKKVLSLLFLSN